MIKKLYQLNKYNKILNIPTIRFYESNSSNGKLTKRQQRKQEEEASMNQIRNLETVAEQKDLTKEKIDSIIQQRKNDILEISKQKTIPNDALIAISLLTCPLLLTPLGLNYICVQGLFIEQLPMISNFYTKYAALNLVFGSGIHWGFSMSMHDMQFDSVNSSPQAKKHFLLSCLPMVSVLGLMNTICYSPIQSTELQISAIGLMGGLYLYNLFLDRKVVTEQQAPKWFFNIKLIMTLISISGLGIYSYLLNNFQDKFEQKQTSIIRQNIPDRDSLLKASMKLSDQQQENTDNIQEAQNKK